MAVVGHGRPDPFECGVFGLDEVGDDFPNGGGPCAGVPDAEVGLAAGITEALLDLAGGFGDRWEKVGRLLQCGDRGHCSVG